MLTLPRIIAFTLFVLELLALAHATPTRAERAVSNAARFAQGLGPARPPAQTALHRHPYQYTSTSASLRHVGLIARFL